MPPKGSRVVKEDNNDSRSDGSSSKQTSGAVPRGKRTNNTSNLKDAQSAYDSGRVAAQASGSSGGASANPPFDWPSESLDLLQKYRLLHRLDTPSAFSNVRNQALLTNPGIGQQSPTMARRRNKRKVGKEQLAQAVRRNFNDAAVSEVDVTVELLYKMKNKDKAFRMRSVPPGKKP